MLTLEQKLNALERHLRLVRKRSGIKGIYGTLELVRTANHLLSVATGWDDAHDAEMLVTRLRARWQQQARVTRIRRKQKRRASVSDTRQYSFNL